MARVSSIVDMPSSLFPFTLKRPNAPLIKGTQQEWDDWQAKRHKYVMDALAKGYTHQQIADGAGIGLSTVRSVIQQARRKARG